MNSDSSASILTELNSSPRQIPGRVTREQVCLVGIQFCRIFNLHLTLWLTVFVGRSRFGATGILVGALGCLAVPYLLVTGVAGSIGKTCSQRTSLLATRSAEAGVMFLAIFGLFQGSLGCLLAALVGLGAVNALTAPALYEFLPRIVRKRRLSWMNAAVGATGVIAASLALATVEIGRAEIQRSGTDLFLIQLADVMCAITAVMIVSGFALVWGLQRGPDPPPDVRQLSNPFRQTMPNLSLLWNQRPLWRAALGIALLWCLGVLTILRFNLDWYGNPGGLVPPFEHWLLLGCVLGGLVAGCLLAGYETGNGVELGLVPLGMLALSSSAFALSFVYVPLTTPSPSFWAMIWMAGLGISAGLFLIPLRAFLQREAPTEQQAQILAAAQCLTYGFILLELVLFWSLRNLVELPMEKILFGIALVTIPALIYVVRLLPNATIRFSVLLVTKVFYRVRIRGLENLPEQGSGLLVSNHVSWLDGILLLITSPRPIRMIAFADYIDRGFKKWLCDLFGVIPIKTNGSPKAILGSLQTARKALQEGELVCIFAEGELTRTGQLQGFQPGLLWILKGTGAPVFPIYLDELWGSIFSFHGGKFFWKRPRRWPYPVTITFGQPLRSVSSAEQVRSAVELLGVESVTNRQSRQLIPPRQFLRACKRAFSRSKIADSSGAELTGGKLLAGSLIMKDLLSKHVLSSDEKMVGVLLPPSVGATLANAALSLMGKVAVNLNYTLSDDTLNYCIQQCGIKHVITSAKFLEMKPVKLNAELVPLEQLKDKSSKAHKTKCFLKALLPTFVLERMLGLTKIKPEDLLTVIFTSGSTGEPKGVMLSHSNVMSNITAVDHLFHINEKDVLLGILPFFHSFGFTGTLWLPLTLDPKVVFHFNPLDARRVGKLAEDHGVTVMMGTPTFMRTYLKRCTKEQFSKLDLVIVGAEKMPMDLHSDFKEKFGIELTEGYGTTELSPVAAFNVPDHRSGAGENSATRLGTVGRVMPGATAKIVDPETGADLGTDKEGLLMIKGPNVMLGYLNQAEKTAEVIQEGWYNTGDFGKIDSQGFITITGRQSRFSKIGGEMVPHIRIEEMLNVLIKDPTDEDPEVQLAVTSVPDSSKGERIIVLHKKLKKPVDELIRGLKESNLPNLWIPGRDGFIEVEAIPLLGTGKLDLKQIKDLALKKSHPVREDVTETSGKSSHGG